MEHVASFANIPIRVEHPKNDPLALAKTLLHELYSLVNKLLQTNENSILDLRALPPLGAEGYKFLKEQLGIGEVKVHIQSFGRSDIQGTAYPGIWWVTHYNQDDELLTEMLEVGFVPQLLKDPKDEVILGQCKLYELLQTLKAAS